MAEKKLRVKLLVDKSSHKILFAEAGKGFVDLLFSFLALPLGSVIRLLTDKSHIDVSISKLYDSVDNLSETHIRSGLSKSSLLDLVTPSLSSCSSSSSQTPHLLLHSNSSDAKAEATTRHYYTCRNACDDQTIQIAFRLRNQGHDMREGFNGYVTDVKGSSCPRCRQSMEYDVGYVAPPSTSGKGVRCIEERGFVKGGTETYMVTDDLEVTPMSPISSITLLSRLNVRDVGALEEKVVEVGMEESWRLEL
ncbi:hypothetical protein CKAN_02483300 [Cinnamomum micranthum f. kanehirae]|uniref:DUF674 domain-containing protein n=1 Tax=Cinnamomum micranthum f. kanehirae TaxID=337451 RepID=A0A443PXI8_9MAGN|nr:hypothetical protein CKAN_02483300 [Cinnamomum micranthum f. kanehirae]